MTNQQRIEHVLTGLNAARKPTDSRNFLQRLLSSLHVRVALRPDIKNPVKKVTLEGGADF